MYTCGRLVLVRYPLPARSWGFPAASSERAQSWPKNPDAHVSVCVCVRVEMRDWQYVCERERMCDLRGEQGHTDRGTLPSRVRVSLFPFLTGLAVAEAGDALPPQVAVTHADLRGADAL
jgi:hypothetical protein